MTIPLPDIPHLRLIVSLFGPRVHLVGGTVRDLLLYGDGASGKDFDLLVTHMTYEEVERLLAGHGKTSTVGKSFAVIKWTMEGTTYDVAVPRTERLLDPTRTDHRNFVVESGPQIPMEDDLLRRDFTCNAMALRLCDGELIDPLEGKSALADREIRMCSPQSFFDDPLRLLRAARFASVHDFSIEARILSEAPRVMLNELSAERIQEELLRLLWESPRPSVGLEHYLHLGILRQCFPELHALTLTLQDDLFHPERDRRGHHSVWGHTLLALDLARTTIIQEGWTREPGLALLLGVLFHDLGKATTSDWLYKRGRLTLVSPRHDAEGVILAEQLMERLRIESRFQYPLREVVLNLIRHHHRPWDMFRDKERVSYRTFSRLLRDLDHALPLLLALDHADRHSRLTHQAPPFREDELTCWLFAELEHYQLDQNRVSPLLQGRHLLSRGIKPGPQMGRLLHQAYEAQLDGYFNTIEEGLEWIVRQDTSQQRPLGENPSQPE